LPTRSSNDTTISDVSARLARNEDELSYIQFLGAAGVVTGSKHLINTGDQTGRQGIQVLIDCGLFQGQKEWRERNWQDLPIPARDIDAVILTHAHLDHSGWIPRLVKQGFHGPIYATPPTIDLCGILLPDSGHLQEEDAAFHNRYKTSKHDPALPLYTMEEAQRCLTLLRPLKLGELKGLSNELSFRLVRAAHILGSSMAEVSLTTNGSTSRLLFTGDIGRVRDNQVSPGKVVRSGPQENESCDYLVMESTYGNRQHPHDDPRPEMAGLIRVTVQRGGSVIVPAFAVERTQKLLFMLKELMETEQIPRVPVHADSPMAIKAVQIFLKYTDEFSPDTKALIEKYGSPLSWPNFHFDQSQEDSKRINESKYPTIIVSSSGMATAAEYCTIWRSAYPTRAIWCCSSASRLPEHADSISRTMRARSRCSGRSCRCAHRSLLWSSSAITPTHRSCWNGCAHSGRRRSKPFWCTASPRLPPSFAIP